MDLTGESSNEIVTLKTPLIASSQSEMNSNSDEGRSQDFGNCIFSLTNSTLSLKSLHFSLIARTDERRQQKNEPGTPRLAIVSDSMLTISESRIEVSSWTSAILISPTQFEESSVDSSVVVQKCLISSENGQLAGVVETSAFPDIRGSVSVSIVGCSFDSSRILGKDGIGLSLTQTAHRSEEEFGTISSSLIGCSFVNVSSIGSSRQPHLPHLSQKMLGCVVSLTTSHLSGSTIRDVNNGGSLFCSNSSFSSLLPSPNTGPEPTPDPSGEYTSHTVDDNKVYYFNKDSGDESSSITFAHCHFTGDKYQPSERPLTFDGYTGTITIESCSFSDIAYNDYFGGVICVNVMGPVEHTSFTANSSNFTRCSSLWSGGAILIDVQEDALIKKCRFENCTTSSADSVGGAICLGRYASTSRIDGKQYNLVDCVIAGCLAISGGGIFQQSPLDLSVVGTQFERCGLLPESPFTMGAAISVNCPTILTIERSTFIECSATLAGGAILSINQKEINVSDTLVKNCYSGTTGAICSFNAGHYGHVSFSNVFFVGNSVGDDSTFYTLMNIDETATKFADVAIVYIHPDPLPTLEFEDWFTTITPDSSGMIIARNVLPSNKFDPERSSDPEFNKIGPLLMAKPTARVNEETGKIELEMKGNTPPISQEYKVTMKEDSDGTETEFKMLFFKGTGTLVSGSDVNLKYNTSYTITKIVGVVPPSSSSTNTNNITIPVAAWTFNLGANPSFTTFTTPAEVSITPPETPVSLISASSDLISAEPKYAYVILVFNEKVKGWRKSEVHCCWKRPSAHSRHNIHN
ncbi:hypothetical protein BLNAU_19352 [Blattamonas nauphoetae]|uniref:Right handed beta helix domain-containing protein n=1 Tax=Blattamonas nauphoetae TaxID=2049346 RepID=A0ABQ9X1V7_9EUKA|nr:hypothetical protein BLNAU_19352 [Blattamonas nauphoetae]